MKDDFARQALVQLLPEEDREELLPDLRRLSTLAAFKYDDYQQFRPGRKFLESLVRWLEKKKPEHRAAAFHFVLNRLIFFSRADVFHYTTMAYRHEVRRRILRHEADALEVPIHRLLHFSRSQTMRAIEKQTIFLGLSDGAHIDDFRRSAGIANDMVHTTYELNDSRLKKMYRHCADWIKKHEQEILDEPYLDSVEPRIRHVCLIDDFTASGTSFIRREGEDWKGKIPSFLKNHPGGKGEAFDWEKTRLFLVFYIASQYARETIIKRMEEYNIWRQKNRKTRLKYELVVVQRLGDEIRIRKDGPEASFIEAQNIEKTGSSSMEKGGHEGHQTWGFYECALPVVLSHNTPNNSIAPLWVYEDLDEPGLFPRITRHWDEE